MTMTSLLPSLYWGASHRNEQDETEKQQEISLDHDFLLSLGEPNVLLGRDET
jgi:hypothetical protein